MTSPTLAGITGGPGWELVLSTQPVPLLEMLLTMMFTRRPRALTPPQTLEVVRALPQIFMVRLVELAQELDRVSPRVVGMPLGRLVRSAAQDPGPLTSAMADPVPLVVQQCLYYFP